MKEGSAPLQLGKPGAFSDFLGGEDSPAFWPPGVFGKTGAGTVQDFECLGFANFFRQAELARDLLLDQDLKQRFANGIFDHSCYRSWARIPTQGEKMGKPVRNRILSKKPWTVQDSEKLYLVSGWGKGYFGISEKGNVEVRVGREGTEPIDLYELSMDLVERGLKPPLLLRFGDILEDRILKVNQAFQGAISEYAYQGDYRGVFPIKFNQQRHVVEEVVHFGRSLGLGLEVGSKPELLIALAMHGDPDSLIICNGFKDTDYIEMALRGRQLGKKIFLVLDRLAELRPCLDLAKKLGVKPLFGIRAKLNSRGAGKWTESAGERSKFGLTAGELLQVTQTCEREGFLDAIQLLHFHIGSQITNIRAIKAALREASRIYVELKKLGAPMGWFDVGGGLGVDYDGSQSNFHSSMNYSLQEYVNDVVFAIEEV